MRVVKVFTKNNCPRCPAAKHVVGKATAEIGEDNITYVDTDTAEGFGEAVAYDVLSTPTIIVLDVRDDDEENELASWRGEAPSYQELLEAYKG